MRENTLIFSKHIYANLHEQRSPSFRLFAAGRVVCGMIKPYNPVL